MHDLLKIETLMVSIFLILEVTRVTTKIRQSEFSVLSMLSEVTYSEGLHTLLYTLLNAPAVLIYTLLYFYQNIITLRIKK